MRTSPERPNVDQFLNNLGNSRTVMSFRKHQVIFSQGDLSNSVFYLQKGTVKLTVTSKQGKKP